MSQAELIYDIIIAGGGYSHIYLPFHLTPTVYRWSLWLCHRRSPRRCRPIAQDPSRRSRTSHARRCNAYAACTVSNPPAAWFYDDEVQRWQEELSPWRPVSCCPLWTMPWRRIERELYVGPLITGPILAQMVYSRYVHTSCRFRLPGLGNGVW